MEPIFNQGPTGTSISPCIKTVIAIGGRSFCSSVTGYLSLRTVTAVVFSGVLGSTVMSSYSC